MSEKSVTSGNEVLLILELELVLVLELGRVGSYSRRHSVRARGLGNSSDKALTRRPNSYSQRVCDRDSPAVWTRDMRRRWRKWDCS